MTYSEKLAILQRIAALTDAESAAPLTLDAACLACGISRLKHWRWTQRLRNGGAEALIDKQSTGRPASFDLGPEGEARLRWHMLRKDSLPLAVADFLRDPACPASAAEVLQGILDGEATRRRKASWPMSVRRACRVSPEERALFRGQKSAQNFEQVVHRSMTYIDEKGEEVLMGPNDLWETDDMSVNEAFRYTDPETGDEATGRQTLVTLDVFANRYLGASPLGRPKDAYRVEDIADHLLACVDAWGMPKVWRLERGAWENNAIDGIPLDGLGPQHEGKRWGGIGGVIRIIRAYSSRGKGTVEGSFNFLQAIMAHASTSIGRVRGEFEGATKDFLATKRGVEKALEKFWTLDEAAAGIARAMLEYNLKPKQRRAFGPDLVVPEELYCPGGQPPAKRALPASERWRFLPEKKIATVRQGAIHTTAKHYPAPFTFNVAGVSGDFWLEHGHKVLIAFHPGRPEEGCHVFNADTGARNRGALGFGEYILTAPPERIAPQFDLRAAGEKGESIKRAGNAAMRSEFRQIKAAGKASATTAASESVARDGFGASLRMARGLGPSPAAETPAADLAPPARGGLAGDAREPGASGRLTTAQKLAALAVADDEHL